MQRKPSHYTSEWKSSSWAATQSRSQWYKHHVLKNQKCHERPDNQHQRQTQPDLCPGCAPVWRQCPSLAAPWRKTPNAQFDTSVQLLQSQPPMQMSDCLRSTQQQPTVPAIRQRPECRKQNVSLLLTREFGKISQCPDLLHLHIHHPGSIQRCNRHCSICVPAK